MERIVAKAVSEHDADMVVFPEYVNIFLIARRYPAAVAESDSVDEAVWRLGGDDPTVADVASLLRRTAPLISREALNFWRQLAAKYQVAIVPGTFFVRPDAHRQGLRNRLYLIDRTGTVIHRQDKVYLTPEESEDLGVEPGNLDAVSPIQIDGLSIGFTICRDTFFDTWNERLGDADVWIDLRANGERYTREVAERFRQTLPQRVGETGAIAGVNATLSGEFLDLVFAGRSYVVDESGHRVAESSSTIGTEITSVTLARHATVWTLTNP